MPRKAADSHPIRPRVHLAGGARVGPGKIDLLKQVDATRSISGAARAMAMSYKRAWQLIDAMNRDFGRPVVATVTGGAGGGGAALTTIGRELVDAYEALETRLNTSAAAELASLQALVRRPR